MNNALSDLLGLDWFEFLFLLNDSFGRRQMLRELSKEGGDGYGDNNWAALIPVGFIALIAIYAIWFFKFKK